MITEKALHVICEEINSHIDSTLKFSCVHCAPSFPKFSKMCVTLNEIKISNQERFDSLETKVNSLESSIKDTVMAETSAMKDQIRTELASDLDKVRDDLSKEISETIEKKLKERDDIAKRERNLFFYKVPESDNPDTKVRIDHDMKLVLEICSELGLANPKLSSVVRFGKPLRNDEGEIDYSKPRPLRVSFVEKSERRHILSNSKGLRSPSNKDLINISISRDLTKVERQKYKALQQELKIRRDAGETNLRIVRGRIVEGSAVEEGAGAGATAAPFP